MIVSQNAPHVLPLVKNCSMIMTETQIQINHNKKHTKHRVRLVGGSIMTSAFPPQELNLSILEKETTHRLVMVISLET